MAQTYQALVEKKKRLQKQQKKIDKQLKKLRGGFKHAAITKFNDDFQVFIKARKGAKRKYLIKVPTMVEALRMGKVIDKVVDHLDKTRIEISGRPTPTQFDLLNQEENHA